MLLVGAFILIPEDPLCAQPSPAHRVVVSELLSRVASRIRGHHSAGRYIDLPPSLTLAGKLRKVPESFERYVSTTTRQYMGHVLGLVKSYWPQTPLDALGKGAKADYTDEKFNQYLQETSVVANQIVESLNKPDSP